jgi:hypothetical protein
VCNDFLGHANPDLFWPFPQDLLALPACLLESLCSAALSSVLGQRRENVQMLVAGQNILYFAHTDSSHNPINLQPKTKVSQASSLQKSDRLAAHQKLVSEKNRFIRAKVRKIAKWSELESILIHCPPNSVGPTFSFRRFE